MTTPAAGSFTALSASTSATVPTKSLGTNTIDAASTAFVQTVAQTAAPIIAAAAGTSDVLTASFTPAITALSNGMSLYVRAGSANTTTTPTLNVNGLGAKTIYKGAGAALATGDIAGAGHWIEVQYDTTLNGWVLLNPATGVSGTPSTSVRQTVLTGTVNSSGVPSALYAASGLTLGCYATSSNLVLAAAKGFGSTGASDQIELISADNASIVTLPASNTSYIYRALWSAWGSTLAPVQYGYAFNQGAQALLHFENNALDDYGNTWTNSGATYNATAKFGSYCMAFNGSSSLQNTVSKPNWNAPFTVDMWVKRGTTGTTQYFFGDSSSSAVNTSIGIQIGFVNTNALVLYFYNSTSYTTMYGPVISDTTTFHHVVVSNDGTNMYLLCDGVLAATAALTPINQNPASTSPMAIGQLGAYTTQAFIGYVDEFCIRPYCVWKANYTVPVSAYSVSTAGFSSDWFSLNDMKMYSVSSPSGVAGTNPTFTSSAKVYVGEAAAGASTISSVTTYTYQQTGKYGSGVLNSLGFGQTWQNVVGSRVSGTTYYNTTGRPIMVFAQCASLSSATFGGLTWTPAQANLGGFIVQPGTAYSLTGTLGVWLELR